MEQDITAENYFHLFRLSCVEKKSIIPLFSVSVYAMRVKNGKRNFVVASETLFSRNMNNVSVADSTSELVQLVVIFVEYRRFMRRVL